MAERAMHAKAAMRKTWLESSEIIHRPACISQRFELT
jgi:hypothetical protein